MKNQVKLVHELPTRLRLKLRQLAYHQRLDKSYLEMELSRQVGIRSVRINLAACAIVLDYNGDATAKTAILTWCEQLSLANYPRLPPHKKTTSPPDIFGMLTAGLAAVMVPFLSLPLKKIVTLVTIMPTLTKATNALVTRGIKVDVLDGVAVGLAAWRGEFFTSVTTHSLLEVGHYLEARTEYQSDSLLRHLLHPLPSKAWIERDGAVIEVDCNDLVEGNVVVIGVGDMIPVDGKVIDGLADVNQASLTGESVPVRKEVGDKVMSGTVVENGRIKIVAMRVGDNTTTARISQFIEESLNKQSATQCLAESLADQRVLYTLALGGLVYALTRNWERVAAVFLVDYACAVKLGTPVAIKSSMYRGATHGILFRGGQSLENLQQADAIVFDKTGTLTTGLLKMTDVISFDEKHWSQQQLLALAASVEEHATHPVADAVVNSARQQHLAHIDHEDVEYVVAHGITTKVNDNQLAIGSLHFLAEHHAINFDAYQTLITRLEGEGKTLLYISLEGEPLGVIALQDHLREEVPSVLAKLRQQGVLRLILLTGDRKDKAVALAEQLHMDEVHYECPPEDKAKVVNALQQQGYKVAFVGDGVNDAPALISAHVGIAMPRGADLARATASVVLLDDHLSALLYAKEISDKTMQMITNHYHFSTTTNSIVAAGAAFGFLSPISTVLLHNGTTIGVLLNALSGVSLTQNRLDELKEKLTTLRDGFR